MNDFLSILFWATYILTQIVLLSLAFLYLTGGGLGFRGGKDGIGRAYPIPIFLGRLSIFFFIILTIGFVYFSVFGF